MKTPDVDNVFVDRERNVEYHVMAYRAITPREMRMAIRVFHSQQRRHPKKNSRVTIVSINGYDS